jgi:hypothetical protein
MSHRVHRRSDPARARAAALAGAALALVVAAGSLGCAFGEFRPDDPLRFQLSLEDAQKAYTNYVRWSKFGEAAQYVEPELRDEFLDHAPRFANFRFTDWDGTPVVLDDEKKSATVRVTYYGYRTDTLIETPVKEVQEWHREGLTHWKVRPSFESTELGLANSKVGRR